LPRAFLPCPSVIETVSKNRLPFSFTTRVFSARHASLRCLLCIYIAAQARLCSRITMSWRGNCMRWYLRIRLLLTRKVFTTRNCRNAS